MHGQLGSGPGAFTQGTNPHAGPSVPASTGEPPPALDELAVFEPAPPKPPVLVELAVFEPAPTKPPVLVELAVAVLALAMLALVEPVEPIEEPPTPPAAPAVSTVEPHATKKNERANHNTVGWRMRCILRGPPDSRQYPGSAPYVIKIGH